MFTTLKQRPQQAQMALLAVLLCAGYWAGFSSFGSETNNEHDPISSASFYMEIGN